MYEDLDAFFVTSTLMTERMTMRLPTILILIAFIEAAGTSFVRADDRELTEASGLFNTRRPTGDERHTRPRVGHCALRPSDPPPVPGGHDRFVGPVVARENQQRARQFVRRPCRRRRPCHENAAAGRYGHPCRWSIRAASDPSLRNPVSDRRGSASGSWDNRRGMTHLCSSR